MQFLHSSQMVTEQVLCNPAVIVTYTIQDGGHACKNSWVVPQYSLRSVPSPQQLMRRIV